MKRTLLLSATLLLSLAAHAKLPAPPPLTDEAKAKAAEAAAKAAHTAKVDNYKLCKSMDVAVANYQKTAAAAGKPATKPSDKAPACADPGPFVAAPAAPAAPAPAAKDAPKKS